MSEQDDVPIEQVLVDVHDPASVRKRRQQDAEIVRLMTVIRQAGATKAQFYAMGRSLNKTLLVGKTREDMNRFLRAIEEDSGGPLTDAPTSLPFRTAKELCANASAEVPYVTRPYLPVASKVSLQGAVKVGKTTFALHEVGQALAGEDRLGFGAEAPTPVIYCTEQPETSFRVALREAGLDQQEHLHTLRIHEVGIRPWRDTAAAIIDYASAVNAKLIVLDTFSRWAGFREDDENSSGASLEALQVLDPAIAAGITVLLIRHTRKSGGGLAEAARGSSAISGEVDVILGLQQASREDPATYRVIEAIGRIDEIPERLTIRLVANPPTPGVRDWRQVGFEVVEGGPDTTRAATKAKPVLDAVQSAGRPITREELVGITKIPDTTLRRILDDLVGKKHLLSGPGGGERGTAIVYTFPSTSRHDPTQGGGELGGGENEELDGDFDSEPPESGIADVPADTGDGPCENEAPRS